MHAKPPDMIQIAQIINNTCRSITLVFLVLSVLYVDTGSAAQAMREIRVGIFQNRPIVFQDEQGIPRGLYIDLLSEVARQEDWKLTYVSDSWARNLQRLRVNEIDLMVSIAHTTKRDLTMDFSKENVLTMWGQVYISDKSNIQNILDLQGSKIGILKGGINGLNFIELCKRFGVESTFITADSYAQVMELLVSGKTDVAVINNIHGLELEKRYKVRKSPILFNPFSLLFAVPEGINKELLSIIDGYLASWKKNNNSIYYETLSRWYDGRLAGEQSIPVWVLYILAWGVGGILVLFIWAKTLQRQVTIRQQAEKSLQRISRALRVLISCEQTLMRAEREEDLLSEICENVVQVGGYRFAWVGCAEHDEKRSVRPIAFAGDDPGYLDSIRISWADIPEGQGPTGVAIRSGKASISRDIKKNPHYTPWREAALKHGFRSSIALPMISGDDDEVFGTLNVYAKDPDHFNQEEVALLTELVSELVYGLDVLRLRHTHQRVEQQLREISDLNEKIIVSSSIGILLYKKSGTCIVVNDAAAKIVGTSRDNVLKQNFRNLSSWKDSGLLEMAECTLREGLQQQKEINVVSTFNKETWLDCTFTPITKDNENHLLILIEDITERKRAEDELQKYGDHQAVLLSEVNHRVKNNLVAIISMLHQEEDRFYDRGKVEYSKRLKEIVGRVDGLLTVHSLLSAKKWRPLSLTQLCDKVIKGAMMGIPVDKSIRLDVEEAETVVDSDQAHYLTLVLNELATNTMKHALKDRKEACVLVTISCKDGEITLVYRDDGPGYPQSVLQGEVDRFSIGFNLINGIVKKSLRGNVKLSNESGSSTCITFSEMMVKKQAEENSYG